MNIVKKYGWYVFALTVFIIAWFYLAYTHTLHDKQDGMALLVASDCFFAIIIATSVTVTTILAGGLLYIVLIILRDLLNLLLPEKEHKKIIKTLKTDSDSVSGSDVFKLGGF